ncbi:thiosulfate oxidation carrier complex protein SoxZ, partial [Alloalcanivorax xenomutans]
GKIMARRFDHEPGSRVRVKLSHPMDSGLIPSTRPFYVEQVAFIRDGEPAATMAWQASVSENPELALTLKGDSDASYRFQARDNNGNEFDHAIP